MEYIDDLSWSNIVKLIQHEETKGADLLNTCANELEEIRKEIAELQSKINRIKSREETLLRASYDIAKHLKRELPLGVQRQGYIVILSKNDLSIERNVI
jgi:hypothetical protein